MTERKTFDPQYEVLVAKGVIENAVTIIARELDTARLVLARLQLVCDLMAEGGSDGTEPYTEKEGE
jgi:hypothetical protein